MTYHYAGARNDARTRIPARQLKPGMFVMFKGRWVLVYGYNQEDETLTIINARRGGLREERTMAPDFIVSVRIQEE